MAWFKKSPPPATEPAVNSQFDQGCYTLILNHLHDEHTNAETLWQKEHTPYPDICEKNTQNPKYRLQVALEKNPAKIPRYDEKLRRLRPEDFIYTDVVVWLPHAVVEKELRQNTGALSFLTTNLPALHRDKFNHKLLKNRTPQYVVLPSQQLQADEVAFQFGFGIYVADAHEIAQFSVEAIYVDAHEQPHPFMPQVSYQADSSTANNQVFSEQDHVFIVKPDEHICANLAYPWFSDICSHIQLQRNKEQWKAFASSSCADTIKIDTQLKGREWHFEFTDSTVMSIGGKIPRLLLILKPFGRYEISNPPVPPLPELSPSPSPKITAPPQVEQNVRANQGWGKTLIPGLDRQQSYRTIIPGADQQDTPLLILEGLALPRIDNAYGRVNGLKQWTIWFDGMGDIVDGENPLARSQLAALSANHQQAVAYFKLAEMRDFQPLNAQSKLYLGNQRAVVLPSPLPERFHAIVRLKNPISFALQSAVDYTVGRKGEDAQPEIDLTLLNDASGMAWEAGSAYEGSVLSMLSLSRNHLSFNLQQGQLHLSVPAHKQPVFVLNKQLKLLATLQDKQDISTAVLQADEYLLLGSFLLRFQK